MVLGEGKPYLSPAISHSVAARGWTGRFPPVASNSPVTLAGCSVTFAPYGCGRGSAERAAMPCPTTPILGQSAKGSSKMKAIFRYYSLFGLFPSPRKLIFKSDAKEVGLDIDC